MSIFYCHFSSCIDKNVEIGSDSKIWHFCHIQTGAVIGKNCIIGQCVNIGPGVIIGDNVKIQNNVSVYEGVTIEDDVFLGPSCVFTNVKRPNLSLGKRNYEKTIVKRGSVIGANATILCGITLGEYCFVGAGSVVTKNVNSYTTVFGNPAVEFIK